MNQLRRLVRDQRGATLLEYIVLVGMVLGLITALAGMSKGIQSNAKQQNQTMADENN